MIKMKPLKNRLIFYLFCLCLLLNACRAAPAQSPDLAAAATRGLPSPTIAPATTFTAPPTSTLTRLPPTPSPSPTILPPTATATPTATPRPKYDITSPDSWPAEMQAYANRPTDSWKTADNPDYVTDAAYDSFLKEARRTFLGKQGMDVESLTDEQIFNEYVGWGVENKQMIKLSPVEMRGLVAGPYEVAYRSDEKNAEGKLHMVFNYGIFDSTRYFGPPPQENIDLAKTLSMTFPVFGKDTLIPRMNYDGAAGYLAGVVELPGVDPKKEVGALMYYNRGGKDYWVLQSASFEPVVHKPGELYLFNNEVHTFQIEQTYEPTYDNYFAPFQAITPQGVVSLLGQPVIFSPRRAASNDPNGVDMSSDLNFAGLEGLWGMWPISVSVPSAEPADFPWNR